LAKYPVLGGKIRAGKRTALPPKELSQK